MADSKFKSRIKAEAGVNLSAETASRALTVDGSGNIASSAVTTTELGYVSGVTSPIQTQLGSNSTAISDHLADASDAHDASAISNVPAGNLAATDVQGALNELQSDVDTRALDSAVIKKDGSVAFTAAQSMGGFKLTSLAAPTVSSDAATKGYVDSALEGLKPKEAVRVATTAAGTLASSFENGDSVDGVTLATGDRILIKDQAAPAENGIYVVQASGAPVRASDFDSLSPIDEINKAYVAVQEGTANAGKLFVQYGVVAVLDTDPINFTFFNSVSGLVGGDGITVSGSNISVDHDGQGLQFVATQLSLELDGTTLAKSASGLKLNDTAVTPGTFGSATQVSQVVVDQQGRLTSASNVTISIPSTQVSDFTEAAQDAVGAMVANSSKVSLTYVDGTPSLTADIVAGSLVNADINAAAAIDATKIADGSVTNAEFQYIGGLTSDAQTQLNGKANTALSNLASTAVNVSVIPDTNNTLDLGSSALKWLNVFTNKVTSDGTNGIHIPNATLLDNSATDSVKYNTRELKSGATVKLSWSGTDISVNTRKITDVSDPTNPQDAATKAYVDAASTGSAGDIAETSFSAANNQVAAADVTGLAFANATVRSFEALVSVTIDATADLFEMFILKGVQKGASWDMAVEAVGDTSGVSFSITNAGQVQYTSTNVAGFVSDTMKFRAITTTV